MEGVTQLLKTTKTREEVEKYFRLAEQWAAKATCPRASVGCVIISTRGTSPEGTHFLSGGYNGSPEGMVTCRQAECIIEGGHCVRSVHAEVRAITYAVRRGIRLDHAEAFTTLLPCIQCYQALLLSGVRVIHYDEMYEREEAEWVQGLAEHAGVHLMRRLRA